MGMFFMGLVESAKNKLQKNETSQQIVSEKLFPSTKNTAHCYCSKADLANSRAFVVFPQFMVQILFLVHPLGVQLLYPVYLTALVLLAQEKIHFLLGLSKNCCFSLCVDGIVNQPAVINLGNRNKSKLLESGFPLERCPAPPLLEMGDAGFGNSQTVHSVGQFTFIAI